jgi:hypothetical protein
MSCLLTWYLCNSLISTVVGSTFPMKGLGDNRTIFMVFYFGQITERVYWRNIANDVRDFVRGCDMCQKVNFLNKPPPATLHPVPVKGLFHRWGIDLVGPMAETVGGNKYIVVATEYLTRWPVAEAITDKSAESVHRFLMRLFSTYGTCQVLLHDQGREFNNLLVNGLCDALNIDVAMTSAYHPQTNGYILYGYLLIFY